MKIIVLMENITVDPKFITEHGLSLYIETKKHRILFDMGQSDAYVQNAKLMNIDLSLVDIAFISHGHYDHGGGLKSFLEINHVAKVYISSEAFTGLYSKKSDGTLAYIGIDKSLENHPQVMLLANDITIDDELEVFKTKTKTFAPPSMNATLMKKIKVQDEEKEEEKEKEAVFKADDFSHEQNLIIHEMDKQVLVAGCAHHGIMNILEEFLQRKGNYPHAALSGFHLSNDRNGFIESEETLAMLVEYLGKTKSQFYTGHCTGIKPYEYLHHHLGQQVRYMFTSRTIDI